MGIKVTEQPGVTFIVENHEKSSGEWAVELAEKLGAVSRLQAESATFDRQADLQVAQIHKVEDILERVKERDRLLSEGKPPPAPRRRMDPMLTYVANDIEQELDNMRKKASKFRVKGITKAKEAETAALEARALQQKVKEAAAKEKSNSAIKEAIIRQAERYHKSVN